MLGLLVGSANSSYDAQSTQVRHLTANIVLLDNLLEQYGPETRDVRDLLRRAVDPLVRRIWREDKSEFAKGTPFRATALAEDAYVKIQNLSPKTDAQRSFRERAIQLATDVAQTRLLLFEHADTSIPIPFLAILIFWLAIIFMSFSLFSRLTPINIVAMLVFAISASAALFLILELSQPFVGLMQFPARRPRAALIVVIPGKMSGLGEGGKGKPANDGADLKVNRWKAASHGTVAKASRSASSAPTYKSDIWCSRALRPRKAARCSSIEEGGD